MEVRGPGNPGTDLTPPAAKPRVVLATLLVRANEAVPIETLITELWDDTPPRTATTTLQVYISHLRKLIADAGPEETPPAIHTGRHGYLLELDTCGLDVSCFERYGEEAAAAQRDGAHAEAAELYARSLALWRGPFLPDVPAGPVLSAAATRLTELRTAALEGRFRAGLRLGRHQELLGELQAAVAEHPLREELHGQLMVALYRAGRQAEALQVFSSLRRTLVQELAIEPGPDLQNLHQRLLAGDRELRRTEPEPPRPAPPAPPAVEPGLLPPEAELDRLDALLRGAPTGGTVVLTGGPGAGKSSLALHAAHRVADAFPDGRILIDLDHARTSPANDPLPRLLRGLGATGPLPDTEPERRGLLDRLLDGRRILIVLDNAPDTEGLRPLLPTAPDSVTLVTTRRAPDEGTPASVLRLSRPSEDQALRMLDSAAGAPHSRTDPDSTARILAACGHVPAALRIAGDRLAAHPHWTPAAFATRLDDETSRLDELRANGQDIRTVLTRGLCPDQRQALARLGLLPAAPFGAPAAAAALDTSPPKAERLLDRLVDDHLLEAERPYGSGLPHYRLPVLLRLLSAELAAEEPAETVAAVTERFCTDFTAAAELAEELIASGTAAAPRDHAGGGAVHGRRPDHWFTEERAALVGAVVLAYERGLWQPALRLARAVTGLLEASAAWPEWNVVQQVALDAAGRLDDPSARAAALRSLGDLAWQQHHLELAADRYEEARRTAESVGDRTEEARALTGLADLTLEHRPSSETRALVERAAEAARASGDRRARFEAARCEALLALADGRSHAATRAFTTCRDLAEALRDRRLDAFARRGLRSATAPCPSDDALELRPAVWRLRGPRP
ncbi:BTAD domain-containing putative transcriptional regulator [Kitasatospora sp. NPDC048545]|uniref:AfsR/SARP family transcriptional regulator n=1 Tax=Kitasatospora sp. NPDC048545 TaxID=3157208 RepID=UPI003410CEAC